MCVCGLKIYKILSIFIICISTLKDIGWSFQNPFMFPVASPSKVLPLSISIPTLNHMTIILEADLYHEMKLWKLKNINMRHWCFHYKMKFSMGRTSSNTRSILLQKKINMYQYVFLLLWKSISLSKINCVTKKQFRWNFKVKLLGQVRWLSGLRHLLRQA